MVHDKRRAIAPTVDSSLLKGRQLCRRTDENNAPSSKFGPLYLAERQRYATVGTETFCGRCDLIAAPIGARLSDHHLTIHDSLAYRTEINQLARGPEVWHHPGQQAARCREVDEVGAVLYDVDSATTTIESAFHELSNVSEALCHRPPPQHRSGNTGNSACVIELP